MSSSIYTRRRLCPFCVCANEWSSEYWMRGSSSGSMDGNSVVVDNTVADDDNDDVVQDENCHHSFRSYDHDSTATKYVFVQTTAFTYLVLCQQRMASQVFSLSQASMKIVFQHNVTATMIKRQSCTSAHTLHNDKATKIRWSRTVQAAGYCAHCAPFCCCRLLDVYSTHINRSHCQWTNRYGIIGCARVRVYACISVFNYEWII